jgi:putative phosphoribosyl transferase
MQIEHQLIKIKLKEVTLEGDLSLPEDPLGFVVFSHGSGNSMHHPKNRYVAERLLKEHIGYLLFDLLTPDEDLNVQNRFNLGNLTQRLEEVIKWVEKDTLDNNLKLGIFGAGTGTAVALKAAARMQGKIETIVTRGGRADLAIDELSYVDIPVLMIVGGKEERSIRLNDKAAELLPNVETIYIDGASNLFEEDGVLEELAATAAQWFKDKLG